MLLLLGCLRYCKSTIFQANHNPFWRFLLSIAVVCDTAKVRFFKQITTREINFFKYLQLFAILQKYDFSSKSQQIRNIISKKACCLRYCKSTIFQANHNSYRHIYSGLQLFAILQKYDFSSKSQHIGKKVVGKNGCLRYCKSTIFQANHNASVWYWYLNEVVCDTAKVRFFKQITTRLIFDLRALALFAILQKYDFSSKSQLS